MRDPTTQKTADAGDSTQDEQLDDLLRAVAHSPPRPPPPDPARPGDRWGTGDRYVIEARLGRGGMGTVYSASDTLLHRTVALKVLDPGSGDDEEAHRARLLREARIAAGVEHERVARVYDVGEHEGTLFVAMELLRGVTLRRWMAGRAASPGEILAVAGQIAEGLAALHAAGVFHRDLKPENVMLTERGGIRLLDFGLARYTTRPGAEGGKPAPPGLVDGESLAAFSGTPGYMAPEQWAGDRLDARVDVFALGVILHELVTGARPFDRPGDAAPTARWLSPDLADAAWKQMPEQLAEVTARMLARDPADRFADGAAVREALAAITAERVAPAALLPPATAAEIGEATTVAAPAAMKPRRRAWVVGGVVAALGVAAAGVMVPLRVVRPRLPPPPGMALIDEGTLRVGRSAEQVAAQCAEIGPSCKRSILEYQVPAGTVTVPAFYLDVREVTNAEMADFLDHIRSSLYVERDEDVQILRYVRFNKGAGPFDGYIYDLWSDLAGIEYTTDQAYRPWPGRESWPVTQVTWPGARLYCTSLGKRLPTEDEWEAAARGHDDREFPWGDSPPACGQVVVPNDGHIPMTGACAKLVSPADVKSAPLDVTPQGVYDLGGNVAEWVDAVYVPGNRLSDVHASGGDLPRVIRGGAFFRSLLARTSVRNQRPPTYVGYDLGFRCASDVIHSPTKE